MGVGALHIVFSFFFFHLPNIQVWSLCGQMTPWQARRTFPSSSAEHTVTCSTEQIELFLSHSLLLRKKKLRKKNSQYWGSIRPRMNSLRKLLPSSGPLPRLVLRVVPGRIHCRPWGGSRGGVSEAKGSGVKEGGAIRPGPPWLGPGACRGSAAPARGSPARAPGPPPRCWRSASRWRSRPSCWRRRPLLLLLLRCHRRTPRWL